MVEEQQKCSSDDQTVKIPKKMVEWVQRQEWFKYYRDFEDFVLEAIRRRTESLIQTKGLDIDR